jgi:hypothetical protein
MHNGLLPETKAVDLGQQLLPRCMEVNIVSPFKKRYDGNDVNRRD